MSIFSRVKKSRQQAKEHNAKLAKQQKKEQEKPPYKHIPTHAAADAMASAPPSWRELDRPKIIEQNRRRSAMAASGHHMNMPGIPRVGSSLSHVSYPTDINANPMVRMHRAYSHTGVSPYSANPSQDIIYPIPDMNVLQRPATSRGKEVVRGPAYDTPRISPTFSKSLPLGPGESGSSSGSTSSQDDLEMKPARLSVPVMGPAPVDMSHRLRPGHRRTSDSSIERFAMANSAKAAGPTKRSRDARPPPSMRGFGFTAPISNAPTPVLQTPLSGSAMSSRQSSNISVHAQMSAYMVATTSAPTTAPAAAPAAQPENTSNLPQLPGKNLDMVGTAESVGMVHTPTSGKFKERRVSKSARFTELEPIESHAKTPALETAPQTTQTKVPVPVVQELLVVNVFPEEDSVPEPELHKRSKRFSRSGGRLSRKDRWASSKAPAVAV